MLLKRIFRPYYCWLGNQIFARTHNQKKCTPNFFCCRWISGNLCEFSLISPFNYSNNFRKRRNFFSYSLSQNFTLEKAVANTSEEGFTRNSSKGEISFKLERISKTWKEKEVRKKFHCYHFDPPLFIWKPHYQWWFHSKIQIFAKCFFFF